MLLSPRSDHVTIGKIGFGRMMRITAPRIKIKA